MGLYSPLRWADLRCALFCGFAQRRTVVSYWRFRRNYPSVYKGESVQALLKMDLRFSQNVGKTANCTLRKISKDLRIHSHSGRSVK